MEKKTPTHKVFKIKFTKTIILLCIAIFILCATGIGLSAWRISRFGIHGFSDIIKYPFLIAVSLFCIVLVISVLLKAQYVVDDTHFITQYGFIKSKFVIQDITAMSLDTDENKLTVNFKEQFIVISVLEEWRNDFVQAILNVNPEIDYSFTLSDAPEPKNDNDGNKE